MQQISCAKTKESQVLKSFLRNVPRTIPSQENTIGPNCELSV